MPKRVVHEIGDRLLQQRGVAAHRQRRFEIETQPATLLLRRRAESLHHVARQFREVERRESRASRAALHLADAQQRLERVENLFDAGDGARDRVLVLEIARALKLAQHLRERPPEIVGDIEPTCFCASSSVLDAVEQAVEGPRQRCQIVVGRGDRDASAPMPLMMPCAALLISCNRARKCRLSQRPPASPSARATPSAHSNAW